MKERGDDMEEMTNAVKPYESLEFTDDFIFWKVLTTDLDLCRELLELVLGVEIEKVELAEGQKTMQPQPDSHGIRCLADLFLLHFSQNTK